MSSTITLANTITWAKSFVSNIDPTLNTGSEPALTSANLVKLTMLGPPFTWRWNRVVTGFVSAVGVQDYLVSNWAGTTVFALGTLVMDTNGNSQQVTTAGTSGGSAPTWNSTLNGFTTDGTVVWKNLGAVATAASSYTLGFIENSSALDIGQTPNKWYELSPKISLALDSSKARPMSISAQKDDNSGNITFRLMPTPDKAYPVVITLQQKPSLFTGTSGTWSPIPDEYSYIYNWGFLTLMYLYDGHDARWAAANQKFVASLLGTQQGLTETERNIFLSNWEAVIGQQPQNNIRMQQGNQARGI